MTTQEIQKLRNRIDNLLRMKAVKSVAKAKAEAYRVIVNTAEENRQWTADQWYGRTSNTTFETLIAYLEN